MKQEDFLDPFKNGTVFMKGELIIIVLVLAFEVVLRYYIIPYIIPFRKNRMKRFFFWMMVRGLFYGLLLLLNYLFS
jgi:hypothetical protein